MIWGQNTKYTLLMFFEHVEIYALFGGPNGPKVCAMHKNHREREIKDSSIVPQDNLVSKSYRVNSETPLAP